TSDPETLGLWGAVHKRLWETGKDPRDLDEAIWAHGKGFYVKDDHYNGINFAFLLNVRASVSSPREALADVVTAERVRRRVAVICTELLSKPITDDQGHVDKEETFWVKASRVEALLGSGDTAKAAAERAAIASDAPEAWMVETMNEQLGKLEALLAATSLPT
ncbi:MAG TPA: tetratricopeptide repeat-containing protein, partial [Vicinamibacterales bacterium]|nr:tetratricopeptide repeat-containing protein [Vicinamibacterales bacterium]